MIDPALEWRKDYYYDEAAAYNAVQFFENEVLHVKGPLAGRPLILEGWQHKFIRRLYGWKRRCDHTRKHRVTFVFVPRKNGKSLLGAGIALYGLVADGIRIPNPEEPGEWIFKPELGAEVVSAAVDRDQARIIFDVCAQIIKLNPRLSELLTVTKKAIVFLDTASKYTVLSADVEKQHGQNSSTIVFDELHTQPNGKLVEVLKTGTAARAQPLEAYFTTAGHDKTSICYEYYDKAKRLLDPLDPTRDPSFLPVIFEAKVDKDNPDFWRDPKVWKEANPNLGVSVRVDYIERIYADACANKRDENSFKRLHLNIWTEQLDRWLSLTDWVECGKNKFDPASHHGEQCVGGLDLSRKIDLTAFVLLFKGPDNLVDVLPYFWCPEKTIRKRASDGVPYLEWAQQGFLKATPGEVIDFDFVRRDINELAALYRIKEIAYDPAFATGLATDLDSDGLNPIEVYSSYRKLSEPSKELEALLTARTLRHNGNPILQWMAANVATEEDAGGNIRPSKKRSKDRIDGIVALVNALSRFIVFRQKKKSRYEEHGLDHAR